LALAAWLQKVAGLKRGERVGLMMPNLLQVPVALFAVLRAGLVVVNINPLYTPRELEHQLNDAGVAALVVVENFAHTVEQVIARIAVRAVVTTQVGDMLPPLKRWLTNAVVKHVKKLVPTWRLPGAVPWRQAMAAGRGHVFDEIPIAPADLAFLQYTGGTTGVAKGAMLTHGNMVANVMQVGAWIAPKLQDGKETLVIPLPLYHVFALTGALSFFCHGAKTVLVANPRDMPAFIRTLKTAHMTAIIGVNTLFRMLLDAPGFAHVDLRGLKLAVAGGIGAAQRGPALAPACGRAPGRRLWADRKRTGGPGQPRDSARVERPDWRALAQHRRRHPGRRRQPPAPGGDRRNLPSRTPGHEGLLAAAAGNRRGVSPGRLAAHRRHGSDGRTRARSPHRPQEGHDCRIGLQGLSQRD